MAMVESSVDEITMEEGTEPPMRVEHARYDGGERDGGAHYSTGLRCLYAAKER